MAESRRYGPNAQLDIEQILQEAQHRWLHPAEICQILQNHKKFRIAPEPPNRPPSGSLFLFDRKVLRYFRKDGHNWRKMKDGQTIKEAHEKLKAGSIDVLHCYYAHGEDNENFQRRSYWMLEEELSHIVLVHYREVKGSRQHCYRVMDADVIPNSRQTEEDKSTSEVDSSAASRFKHYDYQRASQVTDTTSLNSTQASEYEDGESAYWHLASPGFQPLHGLQSSPMQKIEVGSSVPYYPGPISTTQAAARIHQGFRVQSFQRKQMKEYGDSEFGISDERALSLLALKTKKAGQHDEPVHAAAIRIQNKFRSWKGRKDFLLILKRIIQIQAHVRGHQVRKKYKKIMWSGGSIDKVILRWRRKGIGLSGFKPEAFGAGSIRMVDTETKEDDYDFLKVSRKQTEERLNKALPRVKSMVQYPEARDQYRKLLNVVSEMQETKIMPLSSPSSSFAPTATSEEIFWAEDVSTDREMPVDIRLEKEGYLRDCILYCSLFPVDYEFTRDALIWSWLAAGLINSEQNGIREAVAIRCFDELIRSNFIFHSGYDHLADQMRYKLGNEENIFLNNKSLDLRYRKSLEIDTDVTELEHLSLIFEGIDQIHFEILLKCGRLKTLLLHQCYSSKLENLLNDLFLELKFLTTLDLSCTNIVELPSSVENLKALQYLDMSKTHIRRLPESIDSVGSLETLILMECLSLCGLPKGTNKLINLQHSVIDISRQLHSMPIGIGKLTNLQTLRTFLVGTKEGNRIGELRNMNRLKGSLCIMKLENVTNKEEAEKALLCDKNYITKLELIWSDLQDAKITLEEVILESLQPHFGLEELKIVSYSGGILPSWISDPSFTQISSITLHGCRYCEKLPSLGELASLKFLNIVEMDGVVAIDSIFCRKQANRKKHAFPKLEKLSFDGMSNLEKWSGVEDGDFPCLKELVIKYCPKLFDVPSLSYLISLQHLEKIDCPKLWPQKPGVPCLPKKGLPTSQVLFKKKKETSQGWHPIDGGAPIIACPNCFELLKLRRKHISFAKKQRKFKCGACYSTILFENGKNRFIASDSAKVDQVPTEIDDDSCMTEDENVRHWYRMPLVGYE